jgi:uncharacterized protein
MRCIDDPSVAEFAARVLPWLERDPVVDNTIYTVIAARAAEPARASDDGRWMRVLDGADLVGVATVTPPRNALLSDMPVAAAAALAEHLAAAPIPGVTGPAAVADVFAERYVAITGRRRSPGLDMELFRLDALVEPRPAGGHLREANTGDRDLLVDWFTAFAVDVAPHHTPGGEEEFVDSRLASGGLLWLWEDGEPVSLVGTARPAAGVVRVAPVYTPPACRGRGYASSAVASMCRGAFERGAGALILYTDLANPVSNRIYQRLGFRRVGDAREWVFGG